MRGEVFCEIGVAVFRRADRFPPQFRAPELRNVVDDDEIRIQVDHSRDACFQQICKVISGVIERLFERLPDGAGDEIPHSLRIEVIHIELQFRERGSDEALETDFRHQEMEKHTLRALGMLKNRMNGGDGAAQILDVESDRYVDKRRIADAIILRLRRTALPSIAESRCAAEGEFVAGMRRRGESEHRIGVRGTNRLRRREGLEGGGEHNHHHRRRKESGKPHYPQHFGSALEESVLSPLRFEIAAAGGNRRQQER